MRNGSFLSSQKNWFLLKERKFSCRFKDPKIQLNVRFTATRNGGKLAIKAGNARMAAPAEAPRQSGVELTLQAVERWHEERWVQRLLHGEDPDSGEDSASAQEKFSERDVPPEREDPPERSDPPERAQQNAADINRGDPFQNMTEEELVVWRRAEDRFLGSGYRDQVFDSDEDL